jgi:sec-independent protein translocase protein TatC
MPLDQDPHDYPTEEKEMSFLDHLEELRWHVVRSAFAIVFFMIGAFIYTKEIFDNIIFAPGKASFPTFQVLCKVGNFFGMQDAFCIESIPFKIQSRLMTGQFTMQFTAAFVIGLIISFPYVFWEVWSFIKPGLHRKERKFSRGAVFFVSLLFLLGVSFGYFVLCPISIYFFSTYQISDVIVNEFDITSYVSTVVTLVFGSGVLFQLPMVVYFLAKIDMLTPEFMRKYRKHAVVAILIIAAFITPPDVFSLTLIAIPLYLLYEISIFIASSVAKNKRKRELEEEIETAKS